MSNTYATIDDLVRRFGQVEIIQLSDEQSVAVDEDKCNDALEDAAAEIDLYLSTRYQLPLTSVPRVLVNIACDMARAYLYADRITDLVASRLTTARSLLKDLRDGKTMLGLDLAQQPVQTTQGPRSSAAARVFTSDTLDDFINPPFVGTGRTGATGGGGC
jgi:phage gp36-like protein